MIISIGKRAGATSSKIVRLSSNKNQNVWIGWVCSVGEELARPGTFGLGGLLDSGVAGEDKYRWLGGGWGSEPPSRHPPNKPLMQQQRHPGHTTATRQPVIDSKARLGRGMAFTSRCLVPITATRGAVVGAHCCRRDRSFAMGTWVPAPRHPAAQSATTAPDSLGPTLRICATVCLAFAVP